MMEQTTRSFGLRAFTTIAIGAVLIGIGCSMPTPPDAIDNPDQMSAESLNKELPFGVLKSQLAEAREVLVRTEKALADHDAGDTEFASDAIAAERRERLVRMLRVAQESYERLMSEASSASDDAAAEIGERYFRLKLPNDDVDTALVYIDGIHVGTETSSTTDDEHERFSFLRELDRDQIERIEVLKGVAASRLHPDAPPHSVIQITTKDNANQEPNRR